MKVYIIVDTRRETKKGFPVKIRIHDVRLLEIQKTAHLYIPLNIYQKSKELENSIEVRKKQFELDEAVIYCNRNNLSITDIVNVIQNGIPPLDVDLEIAVLETKLKELKKLRPSIGFLEFYEKFREDKLKKSEYVDLFDSAINHFKKFLHPDLDIPINDISYDLVNSLDLYFREHKVASIKEKRLSNATINTYFEKLNALFLNAQKFDDLHVKNKNPFSQVKIKPIDEKKEKNLSLEEVKRYFSIELNYKGRYVKRPSSDLARDMHKFQFLIGGHDFIDIALLRWSDIKDGRLVFKRRKNRKHKFGGKTINNMIHPLALELINRLGTKEDDRIFSFIKDPIDSPTLYRNQRQYYDKVFETIQKEFQIAGNCVLRTKTMRYTFRTIAGNAFIPGIIIEQLMGHINNSISMGYQGSTPFEIQDLEHNKIIDLVFGEKKSETD